MMYIWFSSSLTQISLYPQLEKQVDVDRSDKIKFLSLLTDMGGI